MLLIAKLPDNQSCQTFYIAVQSVKKLQNGQHYTDTTFNKLATLHLSCSYSKNTSPIYVTIWYVESRCSCFYAKRLQIKLGWNWYQNISISLLFLNMFAFRQKEYIITTNNHLTSYLSGSTIYFHKIYSKDPL